METAMRIGELSQATGVDVETIRYYEKTGLLPSPARSSNGYRAYGTACACHLETPNQPAEASTKASARRRRT